METPSLPPGVAETLAGSGPPPRAGAALVVDRWHAWARLWFPDSGELRWVNLDEVDFLPVSAAGPAGGDDG